METSILESQAVAETGIAEMPNCNHQWMIDSPNGPQSRGECRLCGAERYFQNYIEGSSWGYNVTLDQLRGDNNRLPVSTPERSKTSLAEEF
ncbi:MAG: hypothetical protein OXD46_10625 [Chloroflexi bacterium]|nr:hypothetical protein [Chloroflexota bacterium]